MNYEILAWSEDSLKHGPGRWAAVPPTTNQATLSYDKEPTTREVKIRALGTVWEVVIADWGFIFRGHYAVGQRETNTYVRIDHASGKAEGRSQFDKDLTPLQDARMRAGLEEVARGMRVLLAPYIHYAKKAAVVKKIRQLETEADKLKAEFDNRVEQIWELKRQIES